LVTLIEVKYEVFYKNKKIKKQKKKSDKETAGLLTIPKTYLSRLAGIIDGDGYIAVNVVASAAVLKYASIWLKIELIYSDLKMLKAIQNVLGIGRNRYNKRTL
jgi:LAGLIDADG endonuclease